MTVAISVWSAALILLLALFIEKAVNAYYMYRRFRNYDGGCVHSPIKCYHCCALEEKEKHNAHPV